MKKKSNPGDMYNAFQSKKKKVKNTKKVAKVMREFKKGKLHSSSSKGPKVTNPKQAIAIALSEARKGKKA